MYTEEACILLPLPLAEPAEPVSDGVDDDDDDVELKFRPSAEESELSLMS